jgi:hypothetical protein
MHCSIMATAMLMDTKHLLQHMFFHFWMPVPTLQVLHTIRHKHLLSCVSAKQNCYLHELTLLNFMISQQGQHNDIYARNTYAFLYICSYLIATFKRICHMLSNMYTSHHVFTLFTKKEKVSITYGVDFIWNDNWKYKVVQIWPGQTVTF